MNYSKKEVSEKVTAINKSLNKGLLDLLDVLEDIATNGGGDDTFTDEDGNEIRLQFSNKDGNIQVKIGIRQQYSNISVSVDKPEEKMLQDVKKYRLVD